METNYLIEKLELGNRSFTGQNVLITGGARGIGKQTAELLSLLGANVIIADILTEGKIVAENILKNGGKAVFIQCDLSVSEEVIGLGKTVTKTCGQVDILINNAMKLLVKPLLATSFEEWQKVFDTNLRPSFFTIKHFLPGMLERKKGTIVNLIAYEGSPLTSAYSATKVGLRSLAYTTAREIEVGSGVSVFSFIPGIVDTPGLRNDLLPGLTTYTGMTAETLISTVLAQNPGYTALMPVQDCAAALVYTLLHAPEYHGQVADPFEPLQRFGIIQLPSGRESVSVAAGTEAALPQHLKQYLSNVNQTNRDLEQRILLRTNELNEANKELNRQNEEIELQKKLIEEHRKEMIDSITYAKRIQDAILPPVASITKKFPGSFVLYKPKDIVAGDFYWMEEVNGIIFIAAADCTGHGVPGAMVSVVCCNALNRAVKEFGLNETGKILDKITDLVLETFEKSTNEVKDGMDISLLSYNKKDKQINWSGANNPLWYFSENELKELTADKQPIGMSDHRKSFTTHQIEYKNNSVFYLFTDGYADQFGGPKGKKFKYKPFQQLLTETTNTNAEQQVEVLNSTFENWKGKLEQVDDVCVIGIHI